MNLTPPAGLPALPLALTGGSVGAATFTPATASEAFEATDAAIWNAGVYYVKPSTGNNGNPGTSGSPFQTLAYAVRTAAAGSRIVCLESFVEEPFDLRNTDASQATQQAKLVDANGFDVIIRTTGPSLPGQTWAQDGTYTNCYTSTLALTGSAAPTRVLRSDVLDANGYSSQLRSYASAALLDAAASGYFWDSAGKVLWVNLGGADVEAQKAVLQGLYLNTGGLSRHLIIGAALGFAGVRFEGAQFMMLDGGSRLPELWLDGCTQMWAVGKGFDGTITGRYIATDTLVYASQHDNVNGFATSAVSTGLVQTGNCQFINAGDVSAFAVNGTLQGLSCHGGVQHVSFGSTFSGSNGQGVADTCANNKTDVTWLAGCVGGGQGTTAANFEFGSAATSASRSIYMDECSSTANAGGALKTNVNATVTLRSAFVANGSVRNDGGLDDGGFAVTCTTYLGSSGCTLSKSGAWEVTSSGAAWTQPAVSTFTDTGSMRLTDASATAKTFAGGGKTYNNVWFNNAGSGTFDITGSNTFTQLKVDAGRSVRFTAGTTTTAADFDFGAGCTIGSITAASHTLAKTGGGSVLANGATISRSTATPASTFFAESSTNGGNNSGWTFGPRIVATPGAVTIAGQSADLFLYRRIAGTPGAITITGGTARFVWAGVLDGRYRFVVPARTIRFRSGG